MITLLIITGFIVACCVATAGLIASTQSRVDNARAMGGLELGSQIDA